MFRRIVALVILLVFMAQVMVFAAPQPPTNQAEAAVLIVVKTRRVLFSQNESKRMYPASTTKMVTLLTALERGNLDGIVTISSHDVACDGSSLELNPGDKITLRNLLTGMMVVSGNDAAEAVAENIAGSIPAFADMMNARVAKMGLTGTHFTNPHGLPDVNHYTTAMDLARIAAIGLQNPDFAKIVATADYTVNFINRSPLKVTNTNKLLKTFPGCNGVKTGSTEAAGDCLVASAKRGDVQLIVVVLNDDERWVDAANLLEYGFQLTAAGNK